MCFVLAKSVLERLQHGYGNVSWRIPLPHLGDDFTLPLHVCLTLSDARRTICSSVSPFATDPLPSR